MARSMLHDSMLLEIFWSEAVNTVVYLRNRAPTNTGIIKGSRKRYAGIILYSNAVVGMNDHVTDQCFGIVTS